MEIIHISYPLSGTESGETIQQLSMAIGHFDGVHRGHQDVIARAVNAGKERGLKPAVLTFSPHPKEVLGHGQHYFSCLTPPVIKMEQFAELGVQVVYIMKFNHEFAALPPKAFVDSVLEPLGVAHAFVGFDFTFGSKGAGKAETLQELCNPAISVDIVEPFHLEGQKVSSTRVREALEQGELGVVNTLLGRPYEVSGVIVHGDKRGRTIGFPTANLELDGAYVQPRLGVYAITAWINGERHGGVLNFGMKPTFNTGEIKPVMEAHLFSFNREIYGQSMKIQFRHFIRAERKFSSAAELIQQIGLDRDTAESWLHQHLK
ncbi:riboflavin biosynthesis protein RibF [Paenibacillus sp. CAU 1782]